MTIRETAIALLHIFTQSDVYDGLFGDAME